MVIFFWCVFKLFWLTVKKKKLYIVLVLGAGLWGEGLGSGVGVWAAFDCDFCCVSLPTLKCFVIRLHRSCGTVWMGGCVACWPPGSAIVLLRWLSFILSWISSLSSAGCSRTAVALCSAVHHGFEGFFCSTQYKPPVSLAKPLLLRLFMREQTFMSVTLLCWTAADQRSWWVLSVQKFCWNQQEMPGEIELVLQQVGAHVAQCVRAKVVMEVLDYACMQIFAEALEDS